MSKIFYIILAIIALVSVIGLFSFCKQNSTIIESHQGHGGRGHPHGSGSRHGYGGGWGGGYGGGWGGGYGGGWWGRQYAQPIYLNPYSYGYGGGGVNYNCRNGCVNTGNGWGCQYPGWRASDCWFASDCDGCGGGRRGGWWF